MEEVQQQTNQPTNQQQQPTANKNIKIKEITDFSSDLLSGGGAKQLLAL